MKVNEPGTDARALSCCSPIEQACEPVQDRCSGPCSRPRHTAAWRSRNRAPAGWVAWATNAITEGRARFRIGSQWFSGSGLRRACLWGLEPETAEAVKTVEKRHFSVNTTRKLGVRQAIPAAYVGPHTNPKRERGPCRGAPNGLWHPSLTLRVSTALPIRAGRRGPAVVASWRSSVYCKDLRSGGSRHPGRSSQCRRCS